MRSYSKFLKYSFLKHITNKTLLYNQKPVRNSVNFASALEPISFFPLFTAPH